MLGVKCELHYTIKLLSATGVSLCFLSKKMGQNPYYSIISAKIRWRHCDVVFDCIVMIFLLQIYLGTILPHTKIC